MKYLSIILILAALAFSQDVYRLNDSTFVYPCVGDSTGMLNFVGLPVQTDFVNVSDFDPNGDNVNSISVFNASEQKWLTAGYHPALGWGTDYPVETGQAYMLNAVNNFDFTVTGDSVDVVYDLITTAGSDMNMILHPVCMYQLEYLSEIGEDIGTDNCMTINKWNAADQSWHGATWNMLFSQWFGDQPSQAGDALMINMSADTSWPSDPENKEISGLAEQDKSTPKYSGAVPRIIYFNLIDAYTGEPLTEDVTKLIEFSAYITDRPLEEMHEYSPNCGFTMIDSFSVAYVNVGNFPTDWFPGEEFTLIFDNFIDMFGYEAHIVLDESASPIFHGFEPLIPGSGLPGQIETGAIIPLIAPAVETSIQNGQVFLQWSFEGEYSYYIYISDQPYGTFTYHDTAYGIEWSEPVTEDKRFYYVVKSNAGKSDPPKTIEVKQEK